MGGAESYRAQGSGPGIDGLDRLYPGGPFHPLEFASDPDTLAELKVNTCANFGISILLPERLTGAGACLLFTFVA